MAICEDCGLGGGVHTFYCQDPANVLRDAARRRVPPVEEETPEESPAQTPMQLGQARQADRCVRCGHLTITYAVRTGLPMCAQCATKQS